MSDRFDDDVHEEAVVPGRPQSRSRALLITGLVLVLAFFALTTFSSIYTDRLWYRSEGYGDVFSKLFWTRTGLFLVFGVLMAAAVGANMYLAHRFRPFFRPDSPEQAGLERYRDAVLPVRGWLLAGVSAVIGLFSGTAAAGEWRTYLLWANRTDFGRTDLFFRKDIGFYVFELPWLHYLVNFLMAALIISLLAAATVHYLYGGIRLQTPGDRLTGAAQVQFSVLLGLFVLVKAADYWLDRYDLVSASGKLIDGITYTDDHAVLPAKNILLGIAVICSVLFFLNIWRRTWTLPSVGLALLVLSAILLGMIWPGIVQAFQVRPTEPDKEAPYIANNINATRQAYDLQDVDLTTYTGTGVGSNDQEKVLADTASVPLVDPQLVHQSFEQIQQVRSYYSVADVLDVDRYNIDGTDRALVLGARELDQNGLPDDARNWSNLHTVYTHGNGIIAAFANQRPADDGAEGTEIQWAEGQQANQNALSEATGGYQNQVYYGETSPDYSIVGKLPGAPDVELNLGGEADSSESTTYAGKGGVPVGSLFHKILYGVKFGDANFLLSERVNENSKVLYIRNPRERVQKVAPWLTVDSDAYPAVVDGRILWIVDGYTTTDRYPLAEKESIDTMTDDSLSQANNLPIVPTDQINYMRNAVKATVDAYDGTVRLYAWDADDPMLEVWRDAFPGTVLDREQMPEELVSHLRYPEDLFKVQRYQFAKYHVTDPGAFYQKNAWWVVPKDPERPTKLQPPYRLFVEDPDTGVDNFALTSVYVPYEKNNLAAFVSVDSDATVADVRADQGAPAAQREHAGPGQHRQRDAVGPRRHRGPAAAAAGWRVARDLRQPAHAAGHRRPDVRAADLRDASALRRQLPDPAVRHRLVRRQGRHRQHPRERDHRRPRRRHHDPTHGRRHGQPAHRRLRQRPDPGAEPARPGRGVLPEGRRGLRGRQGRPVGHPRRGGSREGRRGHPDPQRDERPDRRADRWATDEPTDGATPSAEETPAE